MVLWLGAAAHVSLWGAGMAYQGPTRVPRRELPTGFAPGFSHQPAAAVLEPRPGGRLPTRLGQAVSWWLKKSSLC